MNLNTLPRSEKMKAARCVPDTEPGIKPN